jgi:hypothetical protein
MARPLSNDKRTAILAAAAAVVAALGVSAPTARIAKGAGPEIGLPGDMEALSGRRVACGTAYTCAKPPSTNSSVPVT